MRIRRSSSWESRGFWAETMGWLRSRAGLAQFLLAAGIGLAIAVAAGLLYRQIGHAVLEPIIDALRAEAEDTIKAALGDNDLPDLRLDIAFEEYQIMAAQRQEALEKGILLLDDEDWLPAQIRYQQETIPVRIRLKGDWLDHLDENKWSFRVKTRNDAVLMGMRSFSIQSPATRNFLLEWLFLEDLRRADILAPRYYFVNVYVNGDDWGIYALEESFAKELLESQGRREGAVVRFDEGLLWEHRAQYGGVDERWEYYLDRIAGTLNTVGFAQVDDFNTNTSLSDPVLSAQRTAAMALLRGFQKGELSPSEVFDPQLMARYLAHSNLWGANHNLIWHNERYYYNPLTARMEPIGYDALPMDPSFARFADLAQYDDLSILESYVQEVARITEPGYLAELQNEYGAEYERYRAALLEEFAPEEMPSPWEMLAERQGLLENTLHPPQTLYAYLVSDASSQVMEIELANILRFPVTLQGIQAGGETIAIKPEWFAEVDQQRLVSSASSSEVILARAAGELPVFATLHVPTSTVEMLLPAQTTPYTGTLQLVTNLYGVPEPIIVDVEREYPSASWMPSRIRQPSLEEALAQHPFLTRSEEAGFLEVKTGSWHVQGDLVLPEGYGLLATQPVTLTFDQEAILFSSEPLILQGPTEGSISLLPQEDHWAGLIVLQAGKGLPSILHNVDIRATYGISREGWITTGGVTFYESPVVLSSSRLLDSQAEDTINVVRTDFEFIQTEFGNAASDAFDGDFVQGTITSCAFHDVRGDAIDVSGSQVTIQDVNLYRILDKGLSAGEGSGISARAIHADDVTIAIASKDMSKVTVDELTIKRASIAGLAAYLKKAEYGPASIEASHVQFLDASNQALVQTGSSVSANGRAYPTTDLDVPALYAQLESLSRMQPADVRFGSAIRLVGYDLVDSEPDPEGNLRLLLYWEAEGKPAADYTVFVHVLNGSGEKVAQRDNMPGNDTLPTSTWGVGQMVSDLHTIPLPPDLAAGEYQVAIGLYQWQTGERLPAQGPSGEIPDGVVLLEQTLRVGD